jgi:CubicO group peptidase (beta-lactamase class C family)
MQIQTTVSDGKYSYPVSGFCDEQFERVLDAFTEGFRRGEEVGANTALMVNGEMVFDLRGGWTDRNRDIPWAEDTIVLTMSTTKGVAAICFNMLIDRGLVELDAPVSLYWPEFSQAGKATLPIRYLLDHRAGLPVLDEVLPPGSIFDFAQITQALARQAPLWEPGTKAAYHVNFQGFLLGEVMRRVTGMNCGEFLRKEVTNLLDLDFHIGLTEAEQARCARFLLEPKLFEVRFAKDRNLLSRSWDEFPTEPDMEVTLNSREFRECEMASANGHGRASALAKLYGVLAVGGELGGVRLMSESSVRRMSTLQHDMFELRANRQYQQALGLLRNSPPAMDMGPNPNVFGHAGIGGSIGMADPDHRFGFGYVMNQQHAVPGTGPRSGRITEAIYACLR